MPRFPTSPAFIYLLYTKIDLRLTRLPILHGYIRAQTLLPVWIWHVQIPLDRFRAYEYYLAPNCDDT